MPEAATRPATILVLGGARSGKSAFAQAQAETSGRECFYVATAQALDDEMRERIATHVAARGPRWRTIEVAYDLPAALAAATSPDRVLLVDCLTLWLSNLMTQDDDVEAAVLALTKTVAALAGPAIFVSNEVGGGIVPANALARRFRDAQGRLNQRMAATCGTVVSVTAGLPRILKPSAPLRLEL